MTGIGSSIATILQGSNAIDVTSIVNQLVAATREPKQAVLDQRTTLNNARVSAIASASSALDIFSSTLTDVLKNSNLSGQPASNDPTIVAVSAKAGGIPKGLPAQIEVQQLASGQILESVNLADTGTAVGLGTLTLTTASGAHTITIDSTNNTLGGLADAINGANAGVTATIVTDNRGSRLVLKGETGDANAFTLTKEATDTADADLARFTFDGATGGMTKRQDALDSIVFIDGVEMQNDTNTLDDAIPFVRIDLNKAAPGTLVTLATDQPTKTTKDLVGDFVAAYNTLRSALNTASASTGDANTAGALAGDPAIRAITNQLSKLTTTQLAGSGPYRTLNDIGVGTNKDGTLKIDTARLDAAIAADPGAVSQMLNPTVSSDTNPGIGLAVKNMRDSLQDENGTLAASKAKYDQLRTELTKQLTKLDEDMSSYEERLSVQYNKMQSQLLAFNATQSYLKQQIDLWTNKTGD
tara:strand:- start:58658 stop:60067 length:1410 start_codon:yes stop_codon:yes gene_type:complete